MRTIEQSLKNQNIGLKLWWGFLAASILLILSPAAADWLISFEFSMAAAFVGIVMAITSMVMIRVYHNRKKLVASLFDNQSLLDVWECIDRYDENKGRPIQAYFSVMGIFYGGTPYPLSSYECTVNEVNLIDDMGPALSIVYSVPSPRNGALRHKHTVSIPVPDHKAEAARNLVGYYFSVLHPQAAQR